MEIVAAVILLGAAVSGFIAFVHLSMGMKIKPGLRLFHIVSVAAGIIALLIYALFTNDHEKHVNVLIMLGVALIPGLLLLSGKPEMKAKKGLSLIYGFIGMFAWLWLLTYIIPQ